MIYGAISRRGAIAQFDHALAFIYATVDGEQSRVAD